MHYCLLILKAALIADKECDEEFNIKCEGYAITCYLEFKNQHHKYTTAAQTKDPTFGESDGSETTISQQTPERGLEGGVSARNPLSRFLSGFIEISKDPQKEKDELEEGSATDSEVSARKPEFEERLIPTASNNAVTRFGDTVYPWNVKMLTALGVKPFNYNSVTIPSRDRKVLCNGALESLLKETEECRVKYALEFEKLLLSDMDTRFIPIKSSLYNYL